MLQVRIALLSFALVLAGAPAAARAAAAPATPARASASSHPKPKRGAQPPLAIVERTRTLLGRSCTVVVEGRGDSAATAAALEDALDAVARLEGVLGTERTGSELERLNAAAGERFTCSSDLYAAIDSAMSVADETEGYFDPTTEPFSRAWDVRGAGRVPAADEIARARVLVGWRTVFREPRGPTVRLPRPGGGLDLDLVGRGYALERLAGVLRERGISRMLADLGGEILAVSNREPWKASVARPDDPRAPAVRLGLSNAALATAVQPPPGSDGTHHGLVLDPRTGLPVRTGASVSVVARSATRAAALSSALLVMGRERAAAFAAEHTGLGVLWLEPGEEGLTAWAWNLPAVEAEPGVSVRWMTRP